MNTRQRVILEAVLVVVGLYACFVYWWHGGDLRVPSYILFVLATAAGYAGFMLRFWRQADWWSNASYWCLAASLVGVFVAALGNFIAVSAGHIGAAYLILAAYGLAVVAIWAERRAVAKRQVEWRRRPASSARRL